MAQKYSKIPQLPGSLGYLDFWLAFLSGPHSLESPLPQGNAILHGAFSSLVNEGRPQNLPQLPSPRAGSFSKKRALARMPNSCLFAQRNLGFRAAR